MPEKDLGNSADSKFQESYKQHGFEEQLYCNRLSNKKMEEKVTPYLEVAVAHVGKSTYLTQILRKIVFREEWPLHKCQVNLSTFSMVQETQ